VFKKPHKQCRLHQSVLTWTDLFPNVFYGNTLPFVYTGISAICTRIISKRQHLDIMSWRKYKHCYFIEL